MAFDSLGRYAPNHKSWDHVGNMIPPAEVSEGARPYGEFRPAAWLPVQFYDKFYEDWLVAMPGKALAFDNDGRLCLAQYGGPATTVVYTQNDVDAGVIDITTGAAVTTAKTVTLSDIDGSTEDFLGRSGEALNISKPCGVAPYAYWKWAGDSGEFDDGFNPSGYSRHNYSLQHRTAIVCDYVLELPLVPATQSSAQNMTESSNANNVSVFAIASVNTPMAKNTVRTPITFADGTQSDSATRFAVEKDTLAGVVSAGDYWVDLTNGNVHAYSASALGAGNLYTVTYSHYGSAPTGSNVSRFACALGNLKAGDFVKHNADSNFIVSTTDDFKDILGQVIEVEDQWDKDALGKVRTAYDSLATDASGGLPGYAGQLDQMPGSATGGVTDKVHYAGAANLVVRINLISR